MDTFPNEYASLLRLMLAQIEQSAQHRAELEQKLKACPAPDLPLLIALHRVCLLRIYLQAGTDPQQLKVALDLSRPVIEWARLQEKQRENALAERKHRDTLKARKQEEKAKPRQALTQQTLEEIERELNLFGE